MKWSGNTFSFWSVEHLLVVVNTFAGVGLLQYKYTQSPKKSTLQSGYSISSIWSILEKVKLVQPGEEMGSWKGSQHPGSPCPRSPPPGLHLAGPLWQALKYDALWIRVNSSWKGRKCPWIIDAGTSHGLTVLPSILLNLSLSRTFQPHRFIFDSLKVKQSLRQLLTRRHPKVNLTWKVN